MTNYVCDGNTRGYSTILGSVEIDGVVYEVLEDSDTKEVTALVKSGENFKGTEYICPDNITYESKQVPVVDIFADAFSSDNLITKYTIGKNIKYVGHYSLSGCKFTEISIPQSVISIGFQVFPSTLKSVRFENPGASSPSLYFQAYAFDGCELDCFEFPARTSLDSGFDYGRCPFIDCKKLKSISINPAYYAVAEEERMLAIVNNALCIKTTRETTDNCLHEHLVVCCYPPLSPVESVSFESEMLTVYMYAFEYAENLKEVSFTASIDEKLVPVYLGEQALTVMPNALSDCPNLERVRLSTNTPLRDMASVGTWSPKFSEYIWESPEKYNYVRDGILYDVNTSVDGSRNITMSAYPYGKSYTEFAVSGDVSALADYLFYDNKLFTKVTLPESIRHIGKYVFYGCENLSEIVFDGRNLESMWVSALQETKYLENISKQDGFVKFATALVAYNGDVPSNLEIPDDVRVICDKVFAEKEELTSVKWPSGLRRIGDNAFATTGLGEIKLPPTCLSLGDGAFFNCQHAKSVSIGDFSGRPAADNPYNVIGKYAFYNLKAADDIKLGTGFNAIGNSAFYGLSDEGRENTDLEIAIPEGVTEIGTQAFAKSCNLTKLSLPSSLKSIGSNAFNAKDLRLGTVAVNLPAPPAFVSMSDVDDCIFNPAILRQATLVIPLTAEESAYSADSMWRFRKIDRQEFVGADFVVAEDSDFIINGREITTTAGSTVELFSIDGTLIAGGSHIVVSHPGLYIVKTLRSSRTILIR